MTKRIVVVGSGQMGMGHLACLIERYAQTGEVAAGICSRNETVRSGNLQSCRRNNLGISIPGSFDPKEVKPYSHLSEVIADSDVIGIVLATPTSYHLAMTSVAIRAGKHVFVEKPICLKVSEVPPFQRLLDQNPSVVCAVGHILPYFDAFNQLAQFLNGKQGVRLNLSRFVNVTDPLASPDMADKNGNAFFDLAVHDLHLLSLTFGEPNADLQVIERETTDGGYLLRAKVGLSFAGDNYVTLDAGIDRQQPAAFRHAFEVTTNSGNFRYELGQDVPNFSDVAGLSAPSYFESWCRGPAVPVHAEHRQFLDAILSGSVQRDCALHPNHAIAAVQLALQVG